MKIKEESSSETSDIYSDAEERRDTILVPPLVDQFYPFLPSATQKVYTFQESNKVMQPSDACL